MKRFNTEMAVGLFVVMGLLALSYLSVKLGNVPLFGSDRYTVQARFGSISGLKAGASVEISGVPVGQVMAIRLDGDDYDAVVALAIDRNVQLQEDSIASIRTAGIIGDRYVDIQPGGMEDLIPPGGRIEETESAVNLEELISKYVFESE